MLQLQITQEYYLEHQKKVKSIAYIFKWLEFLQRRNKFSFQVTVRIDFIDVNFKILYSIEKIVAKEYSYWPSILNLKPSTRFESSIENNIWQELFSSTYKSDYEYVQIYNINHKLVSKLYDFIATEADAPPA